MQPQSGQRTAPTHGLIGFFDILGYKNIVKFNSVDRAKTLSETILEIAKNSESAIGTVGSLVNENFAEHVLFSDSILVYADLRGRSKRASRIKMFVSHCVGLMNNLLLAGFPVRGAISVGPYSIRQEPRYLTIVGKPIIEAYELSEAIQLAGCVISPMAERYFKNEDTFLYDVPLKGSSQKMLMINNCASSWDKKNWSRREIAGKFLAHNKLLDLEMMPKINNTIAFLKKCQSVGIPPVTGKLTGQRPLP